ncbi:MAG TPA: hypothetical protein VF215_03335, partial [Thermoanaerobaculia bacterium]
RDTRALDSGTLQSWGLIFQFANDEPLTERPRSFLAESMIPVVAHVFGVGATRFVSDVRIANPNGFEWTATVIFTRSGEDGNANFLAENVHLEAGATASFDDIVDSLFHTAGSGSLQVLGPVVTMSRTYADTPAGTLGQQVPPVRDTTALGETPLALGPLPEEGSRYNIGITELDGHRGVVQIGDRRIEVLPFSHVQFSGDSRFVTVSVVEGEARVGAYVSQVNAIGDAMFIPAETLSDDGSRSLIAPAISVDEWHSDLWFSSAAEVRVIPDALWDGVRQHFGVLGVGPQAGMLAGSRIHSSRGTDQFIPFAGFHDLIERDQQLLFIETVPPYRTNVGIFNYYAREATAEVVVYDAAGVEMQREVLRTVNGVAQMPVTAGVSGGRAVVRFLSGLDLGPGFGYASLIDGRTGDATYIRGQ